MNLKNIWSRFYDFGEVNFVVDADFRTVAQGWSTSDLTGPLDLSIMANKGHAFYTSGTNVSGHAATDAAAIQAAHDACVDFRGDTVFFTPGSYTPATAIAATKSNVRWMGPQVANPRLARATFTAGVTSAWGLSAAADRNEIAFLKIVPLTAAPVLALTAGANQFHMHDFWYDARGITGSTSTLLMTAGAASDHLFNNFVVNTDAAQGAPLTYTGTATCISIRDFVLWHGAGTTLAIALADFQGAATGVEVENGRGNLTGLASSAVTNLIKFSESGGDISTLTIRNFRGAIGFCAASALVSLNGAEAAETGVAASYLDVVGGGAGGLGTTYTQ